MHMEMKSQSDMCRLTFYSVVVFGDTKVSGAGDFIFYMVQEMKTCYN